MLEEKHENLPLMEVIFYTLFLSFNTKDEDIWVDTEALHNYYGFPTRFAIDEQIVNDSLLVSEENFDNQVIPRLIWLSSVILLIAKTIDSFGFLTG